MVGSRLAGRSLAIRVGLASLIGSVTAVFLQLTGLLSGLDWALLDRVPVRQSTGTPSASVVLVAIDDRSLEKHGRWPWSRAQLARLIDAVGESTAPIALDLLLLEADDDREGDARLAAAIGSRANILLPVPTLRPHETLDAAAQVAQLWPGASVVHTDFRFERQGVVRVLHKRIAAGDVVIPSMAVALMRPDQAPQASSLESMRPSVGAADSGEWQRLDPVAVSMELHGDSVEVYSACDVLDGQVAPTAFAGRPVIVGVTARGLAHSFPVPDGQGEFALLSGAQLTAVTAAAVAENRLSRIPASTTRLLVVGIVALVLCGLLALLPWRYASLALPLSLLPLALAWIGRAVFATNLLVVSASAAVLIVFLFLAWLRMRADRRRLQATRAHIDNAVASSMRTVVAVAADGRVLFSTDTGQGADGGEFATDRTDATLSQWPHGSELQELLDEVRHAGQARSRRLRSQDGVQTTADLLATVTPAQFGGMNGFLVVLGTSQVKEWAGNWRTETDALTGLPNRRKLWSNLVSMTSSTTTAPTNVILALVAIDGFRRINEALGESEGDAALRGVASALSVAASSQARVYRWSGDQFAVLHAHTPGAQAVSPSELAKRISALFADRRVDFRGMTLRASVGVASAPVAVDELRTLVQRAERALAEVKRAGGSHWRVDTDSSGWTIDHLEIEREIRAALGRDEFFMVYQPIIDAASGQWFRLEALLRWRHPKLGVVGPGRFLDIAEASALEIDLGRFVMSRVGFDHRYLAGKGVDLPISLNVSARHFERDSFLDDIRGLAAGEHQGSFIIEITESMALRNPDRAAQVARTLAEMGVGLSLDDLLSGHSSLALLRSLRVQEIKLDGDLVARVEHDDDAATLVRGIIELARTLRVAVIAEGVETMSQSEWLLQAGCRLQQGFLFSPPVIREQVDGDAGSTVVPQVSNLANSR